MGSALIIDRVPGGRLALAELYNTPIEAVSWAMRGLLCAAPGHRLIAADFSNIEGRAIAWLAGESWKLQAFRDYDAGTGADLYKITAGKILNIAPAAVSKTQRQAVGKPSELGLGFGGGVGAILTMMRNGAVTPWMKRDGTTPAKITLDDIAATVRAGVPPQVWADTEAKYAEGAIETAAEILEEQRLQEQWLAENDDEEAANPFATDDELVNLAVEVAKQNRLNLSMEHWTALKCIVDLWRRSNSKIAEFWKDLERAAKSAVQNPGQVFQAGQHVQFCKRGIFLVMRLPSGRCIHYPYAKLATGKNKWGKEGEQLIYMRRVNGRTGRWFFKPLYGGLIAENCIAGDARVLTRRGWIELRTLRIADHVFDGVEFVAHGGLIAKGMQQTIALDGVRMTPEHKILTSEGWRCASSCSGYHRSTVRVPYRAGIQRLGWSQVTLDRSLRLRRHETDSRNRIAEGPGTLVRLQTAGVAARGDDYARHVEPSGVSRLAGHAGAVFAVDAPGLAQLRGPRHIRVRRMAELPGILARHGADLPHGVDAGPGGQQWKLFASELRVANNAPASAEHAVQPVLRKPARAHDCGRAVRANRDWRNYAFISVKSRLDRFEPTAAAGPAEPVYDILNCGPRNRFVVLGERAPFIAHNCTQAVARDVLRDAMLRLRAAGYKIVLHVHDEIIAEMLRGIGSLDEFKAIMAQLERWALGLPVAVDGWEGRRFRK
ncbi:MAG: hypothetical protein ACR2K1_08800 [Saprospiraceae bacterium]